MEVAYARIYRSERCTGVNQGGDQEKGEEGAGVSSAPSVL